MTELWKTRLKAMILRSQQHPVEEVQLAARTFLVDYLPHSRTKLEFLKFLSSFPRPLSLLKRSILEYPPWSTRTSHSIPSLSLQASAYANMKLRPAHIPHPARNLVGKHQVQCGLNGVRKLKSLKHDPAILTYFSQSNRWKREPVTTTSHLPFYFPQSVRVL